MIELREINHIGDVRNGSSMLVVEWYITTIDIVLQGGFLQLLGREPRLERVVVPGERITDPEVVGRHIDRMGCRHTDQDSTSQNNRLDLVNLLEIGVA